MTSSTRTRRSPRAAYFDSSLATNENIAIALMLLAVILLVLLYELRLPLRPFAAVGCLTTGAVAVNSLKRMLSKEQGRNGPAFVAPMGFGAVALLGVQLPGLAAPSDMTTDVLVRLNYYVPSNYDLRFATFVFAVSSLLLLASTSILFRRLEDGRPPKATSGDVLREVSAVEISLLCIFAFFGAALQLSADRTQTFIDRGNVGSTSVLTVFFWAIPVLAAVFIASSKLPVLVRVAIVLLCVGVLIYSGNRSPILLVVCALLVNLRGKPFRPRVLVTFIILGYLLVIAATGIATWRANLARGTEVSIVATTADAAADPVSAALATGLDSRAGFIFARRVVADSPQAHPFDLLKAPASLIPRAVWENKPTWLGNEVSQEYLGVGRGGIFLSEPGYLTFVTGSVAGAILGVLVLGALISLAAKHFANDRVLLAITFYFAVTFTMGGDAFNLFNVAIASIPLVLARTISKVVVAGATRAHRSPSPLSRPVG